MWSRGAGIREGDRYLIVNPFFHTFGYKAGWLACLQVGATAIPHAVFDAGAVLERIGKERITVLPGAADALPVAARAPRPRRRSTSRACASR